MGPRVTKTHCQSDNHQMASMCCMTHSDPVINCLVHKAEWQGGEMTNPRDIATQHKDPPGDHRKMMRQCYSRHSPFCFSARSYVPPKGSQGLLSFQAVNRSFPAVIRSSSLKSPGFSPESAAELRFYEYFIIV